MSSVESPAPHRDDQRSYELLIQLGWLLMEFRHYAEIAWSVRSEPDSTGVAVTPLWRIRAQVHHIAAELASTARSAVSAACRHLDEAISEAVEEFEATLSASHEPRGESGEAGECHPRLLPVEFRDRFESLDDQSGSYPNSLRSNPFASDDRWIELDRIAAEMRNNLVEPERHYFLLGCFLAFGAFPIYTLNLFSEAPMHVGEFEYNVRQRVRTLIGFINRESASRLSQLLQSPPVLTAEENDDPDYYFIVYEESLRRVASSACDPTPGYLGLILDRSRHAVRRPESAENVVLRRSLDWQVFEALFQGEGSLVRNEELYDAWGESQSGLTEALPQRLQQVISHLRQLLAPLGIDIVSLRGSGYLLRERDSSS